VDPAEPAVKDHLLQIVRAEPVARRENLAREYLHVYLLRLLHDAGAMSSLAFVGGTALRLLHRLPRFSEDLDFAGGPADPAKLFADLARRLDESGYRIVVRRAGTRRNVASAFFRFEGLLKEAGTKADPRLGLSIRLEFDRRPPAGAVIETTLVQRFFPVMLRHHDLPSLFAGKLHAILARPYAKGRDWFDLVWYLTEHRGLEPNATLLANALTQTGHAVVDDWRAAALRRLQSLRWPEVLRDLRPFVERQSDLDVLSQEAIVKLLTHR
jgi:hypothetical protein